MKHLKQMKQILYGSTFGLMFFFNIPNDISNAAIAIISVHKDYFGINLIQEYQILTTDTTPLIYNTEFDERISKQSFI